MEKFTNYELLGHFRDAICDNNYNPSGDEYNESGYSLNELHNEVIKRMGGRE